MQHQPSTVSALRVGSLVLVLCLGLAMVASPARGAEGGQAGDHALLVSCDRGETIAKQLDRNETKLVIEFSGTCREHLLIERDGVEIRGSGAGATLIGSVRLIGSSRVVLEGFTIRDNTERGGAI